MTRVNVPNRGMRVLLLAALFNGAAIGILCGQTDVTLQTGTARQATLARGESRTYRITLSPEDLALGQIEKATAPLELVTRDDGGHVLRRFSSQSGSLAFSLVAEGAGMYRIEVTAPQADASFSIRLRQVLSLEQRVSSAPVRRLEGQRIAQLRSELRNHSGDTLTRFWNEAEKAGTPFVETIPNDDYHVLCTFLYRGNENTRNVMVLLYPFVFRSREDYTMARIDGTDVWFASVKLPLRGRFSYGLGVNIPVDLARMDATPEERQRFYASHRRDLLNPHIWPGTAADGKFESSSLLELRGAPPEPWLTPAPGIARGSLEQKEYVSKTLGNRRRISVYLPAGYSRTGAPQDLLILFDEDKYTTDVPSPVILDNLIAAGKIPPLLTVLVGNAPDARSRELGCNPTFSEFLSTELLEWIRREYNVTTRPDRTIIGGSSFGGLAATCAAKQYPERFGNVLSQSGSYWWTPPPPQGKPADPYREPNYIADWFLGSARLPIRFYMDAGTLELDFTGQGRSILLPNRHFRDVLLAKGYEVHYAEFVGYHTYLSWRGTLSDGLIALAGPWLRSN